MKKFRAETTTERIERLHHIHDGGPKPKHYDNPKVIDQENLGKRPKPFNNNDRSTYVSDRDQKQRLSTWDVILDDTIKNGSPADKKEMREYLREKAKDPITKSYLNKKELNFISTPKPVVNIPLPKIDFSPIPTVASAPTPEERAMEQRFNQMMEDDRKEKIKNQNSGLAGLLGGGSKLYE